MTKFAVTLGILGYKLLVKQIISETKKMITFEGNDRRMKTNARVVATFESREAAEAAIAATNAKWDARIEELMTIAAAATENCRNAKQERLDMIRDLAK